MNKIIDEYANIFEEKKIAAVVLTFFLLCGQIKQ